MSSTKNRLSTQEISTLQTEIEYLTKYMKKDVMARLSETIDLSEPGKRKEHFYRIKHLRELNRRIRFLEECLRDTTKAAVDAST